MSSPHFIIKKPDNDPNYKLGFTCFFLLESCFYKANLQIDRIEQEKKDHKLPMLFADIHFFLVSVSNLKKILEKLKKIYPKDAQLKKIYKKYKIQLNRLADFRHHLEHIDHNRMEGKDGKGKPLKNPNMLGNLFNDNYDFGGEIFNLTKSFSLINNLEKDIGNWNMGTEKFPWSNSMLGNNL